MCHVEVRGQLQVSYCRSLWDLGTELRSSDLHSEHFTLCIIMMAPSQFVVFCFVFETRSAYVAHPGLELSILSML